MKIFLTFLVIFLNILNFSNTINVVSCEGFIKTSTTLKESLENSGKKLDFSSLKILLQNKDGKVKDTTTCSPTGYYVLPIYDAGEYFLVVSHDKKGWNFENEKQKIVIKENGESTCKQGHDINFILHGFSIHGKVSGYNADSSVTTGPEDVIVNLYNMEDDKIFDTTKTEEDGFYKFKNVVLGKYSLRISHPNWTIEKEKSSVEIEVSNDGLEVKNELRVLGYDVNGKILSEGLPMIGVTLYLFSVNENVDKSKFNECKSSSASLMVNEEVSDPHKSSLCSCKSDKFGLFKFVGVPSGTYIIRPYYKGFFIAPSEMKINVDLGSVNIDKVFEVKGFSVSGLVVNRINNEGIENAEIYVNGKKHTTTDEKGSYTLKEMKTGHYTIEAKKEFHKFLVRSNVHITPNLSSINPIVLTHYSVCGTILINSDFAESKGIKIEGRKVMLSSINYSQSTQTKESGEFCFDTRVGVTEATVEPVVSVIEKTNLGLVFSPNKINIKLENKPIFGLVFKQTLFNIKGKVTCLKEQCDSDFVIKLFKSNLDGIPIQTISELKNNEFEFNDLYIGTYIVSIVNEAFCFEKQSHLVNLNAKDLNIEFKQEGYKMHILSSHNSVNVKIHHDLAEPNKEITKTLKYGKNSICLLDGSGIYKIIPQSCYKFEHETYHFNTNSPEQVLLEAVNVLVVGKIKIKREGKQTEYEKNLELTIKKIDNGLKTVKGNAVFKSEVNGILEYEYEYWALFNEEVEIIPKSNLLLFYPQSIKYEATKSTCPQEFPLFNARKGLFIEGKIFGGVPDVSVEIFENGNKIISLISDKEGKYKAGPLYDNKEYTVNCFKEGYYLIKKSKYNFLATKLSTVEIIVKDTNNESIEGVFLSLSGDNFRSNSLSEKNGTKIFKNLYTGDYFLRPVLREYEFDPKTYSFNLGQGETKKLIINAKRVGYSCFGSIRSLNGLPEKSVVVQAVSEGKDAEFYDTVTDSDGSFRIRGLKPNKNYQIKIRQNDIERSSPEFFNLKMEKKDIKDINFIAFRNDNKIRISGYVDTSIKNVKHVEVQLLIGGNPSFTTVLKTSDIGTDRYFQFTTEKSSKLQNHYLKIVSKLSSRYEFKSEIVQVDESKLYNNVLKFYPTPKSDQDVVDRKPLYGLLFCLFWFLSIFYWNDIISIKNALFESRINKKKR